MAEIPKATETELSELYGRVRMAHEAIRTSVHRTPVLTSTALDSECAGSLFLKCENFQKTGSFKIRGATNAIGSLTEEEKSRGVVAHSSGNHAQAVASAARDAGASARIVMPRDSAKIKILATRGYGAEVFFCEPTLASREERSSELIREHGSILIHPFDDERIIAGQATAAKELFEDIEDLDYVFAPVSGGGLLSGTCVSARALSPSTRIIGCEPKNADDTHRSFLTGKLEKASSESTIADGLRATVGARPFAVIRAVASDIVTVTEAEIVEAMRFVWERMKIIIEPSSAVAVAPILTGKFDVRGARVGAIISGGNIDLEEFFASML